MSLEFVSGAVFALGLLLIGWWLRDRWRSRRAASKTRPPPPLPTVDGVDDLEPTGGVADDPRRRKNRGAPNA